MVFNMAKIARAEKLFSFPASLTLTKHWQGDFWALPAAARGRKDLEQK